ncbi:preprotein translocase subunit SecE [Candidatus Dependentiae bacterium]|nr:MAG: preprotein translocase subunit SecE [Candidatus Dependentiae bacterium]
MKDAVKFFNEVRVELSKVIWPSWDEFVGSTIIVLVVIAFFSGYLGVLDFGLSRIADYIFSRFGVYWL